MPRFLPSTPWFHTQVRYQNSVSNPPTHNCSPQSSLSLQWLWHCMFSYKAPSTLHSSCWKEVLMNPTAHVQSTVQSLWGSAMRRPAGGGHKSNVKTPGPALGSSFPQWWWPKESGTCYSHSGPEECFQLLAPVPAQPSFRGSFRVSQSVRIVCLYVSPPPQA